MIVMKFGGTSVGIPANFSAALAIVAERAQRQEGDPPVVVVSALHGITNLLVEWCRESSHRGARGGVIDLRHREFVRDAGLELRAIQPLLGEWGSVSAAFAAMSGVLQDAPRDRVLAFGERLAAALFAAGLRQRGIAADAIEAGEAGFVTDERFGAASPLPEAATLLRERFATRDRVWVMTGFLGRTRDGRVTTLGRGGSDFSAAFLGAALGADEIQIWTDTSGLLSADPRIVPEARPVPHLSFAEASELAYFGAKVLHPKTLLPAMDRAIPVRVLNTGRPADPGSLVTPESQLAESSWRVKSIASKKGITAVTIASSRMLLAHGFLARVFEVFGRHHVVVDLVTTSEVSISVTVDETTHLDPALQELEAIGRVEVRRDLAVVAVVGEGAPARVGLPGHVFTLLGGVGIGIEMISQGASRVNLSFVVRDEDADRAVRLLHRGLGLDLEAVDDPIAARDSRA
jgi:aspartate kinase